MKMGFITSQVPNTGCNFHVVIWSFCITIPFGTTTRSWIQDDSAATRLNRADSSALCAQFLVCV